MKRLDLMRADLIEITKHFACNSAFFYRFANHFGSTVMFAVGWLVGILGPNGRLFLSITFISHDRLLRLIENHGTFELENGAKIELMKSSLTGKRPQPLLNSPPSTRYSHATAPPVPSPT